MAQQLDQQLVLRVMRLARPKFNDPICLPIDPSSPSDDYGPLIAEAVKRSSGQDSVDFPIGSYLMAPQSMEVIYLGETFTFYVAVLNEGEHACTDICVKADIQTLSQRISLACQLQEANAVLEPQRLLGQLVKHEIKEIGQHILVVGVNYKTHTGVKMYFRKFFKFPVNKPIDVRTKFYNAEDNMSNDVYLEAQIQNLCESSMVLERVVLEPSELYSCSEIRASNGEGEQEHVYLEPQATYQYLYCLSLSNTSVGAHHHQRGVSSIGKLDMSWRTSMGEKGRLQTSPLQRMMPGYGDLRLTIEKIPRRVKLHELFSVVCRLSNCCERSLDLVLTLDGSLNPSVIYCSVSGLHLGQVLPNNSIEFTIDALSIAGGLQCISGIRITDTLLKRTHELDELAQILVVV